MVGGRTDNAVKVRVLALMTEDRSMHAVACHPCWRRNKKIPVFLSQNRWHAICKRGSKGGYSAWEEGVPGSVGRPKGRGGSKGGSATKSGGRVKARGRNDDDEDGSDDDDDEDDEDEDEEETDDDDEHGRGSRRKSVGVSGRKGRPPSTLKKQQLADQNLERLRQPSNLFMGSARPMAGGGGFTQMLQLPLNNDLEDPSQQPLGSAGGNYTGFLARSPRYEGVGLGEHWQEVLLKSANADLKENTQSYGPFAIILCRTCILYHCQRVPLYRKPRTSSYLVPAHALSPLHLGSPTRSTSRGPCWPLRAAPSFSLSQHWVGPSTPSHHRWVGRQGL